MSARLRVHLLTEPSIGYDTLRAYRFIYARGELFVRVALGVKKDCFYFCDLYYWRRMTRKVLMQFAKVARASRPCAWVQNCRSKKSWERLLFAAWRRLNLARPFKGKYIFDSHDLQPRSGKRSVAYGVSHGIAWKNQPEPQRGGTLPDRVSPLARLASFTDRYPRLTPRATEHPPASRAG